MNNIVLTTYLTQRPDPQRGTIWPADCDQTVQTWIDSVEICRLHAIIFHDGLSPEFVERWSSEFVSFQPVGWTTTGSALEERWRIYRDWLQDHEVDWCMTTDLSDVEFLRDPFLVMTEADKLYIGSELNRIGNTCIADWMRRAYGGVVYPQRAILNPGILGGRRPTLIYFLNLCLSELVMALTRTQPPLDVAVIDRLIYREHLPFVTGHPLHTIFRRNEGLLSGAAIRHK